MKCHCIIFVLQALFASLAATNTLHAATSYRVLVPGNGMQFVAYPYQAASIAEALPTVPQSTMVYHWDVDEQSWEINTYLLGEWTDPDYEIGPGEGFFLKNPTSSAYEFSVFGTVMTQSAYTITLPEVNVYYAVGSAYPINISTGNFLECTGHYYVPASLNYTANLGDKIYLWNAVEAQWIEQSRTNISRNVTWTGEGVGVSPTIQLLRNPDEDFRYAAGFLIKPAQTNSWTHIKGTLTGTDCP